MNGKDKFIFFILLLLVLGAGYYYTMTESIFLRMDQLQTADKKHVDKVLGAYADSLDRYNLRFIGRGKHMRKMQKCAHYINVCAECVFTCCKCYILKM